ncbi:hypothetical protein BJ170DRAFT_150927 [Xylariales sp. AK1849]|nr:hypothetical protein BJ170DRAFT_150927 [Xylariales sp. AK1849]
MSATPMPAVQVREFPVPTGRLGRNILVCGIVMLFSSRRAFIAPGSPLYDYVLAGRPAAFTSATWVQNGLFYLLFGAHAVESVIFAITKLRKHAVPAFSFLWLKWVVACFVGGVFATKHFDNVVAAAGKSQ